MWLARSSAATLTASCSPFWAMRTSWQSCSQHLIFLDHWTVFWQVCSICLFLPYFKIQERFPRVFSLPHYMWFRCTFCRGFLSLSSVEKGLHESKAQSNCSMVPPRACVSHGSEVCYFIAYLTDEPCLLLSSKLVYFLSKIVVVLQATSHGLLWWSTSDAKRTAERVKPQQTL